MPAVPRACMDRRTACGSLLLRSAPAILRPPQRALSPRARGGCLGEALPALPGATPAPQQVCGTSSGSSCDRGLTTPAPETSAYTCTLRGLGRGLHTGADGARPRPSQKAFAASNSKPWPSLDITSSALANTASQVTTPTERAILADRTSRSHTARPDRRRSRNRERRRLWIARNPAQPCGIPGPLKRRGRDLNPRRTLKPETVFETAAFDRSATPPRPAHRTGTGSWRRDGTEKEGFEPSMETFIPITP